MVWVRGLTEEDRAWKHDALLRVWRSTSIARRGELVECIDLDGFVALDGEVPIGLLTYALQDDELEVVTIHVDREGIGAGRALMDATLARATDAGVRRIWLSTTNDNVRGFDFYQRWGMRLSAFRRDGVAASRAVKPSIPLVSDGIPMRDELEFELLTAARMTEPALRAGSRHPDR